MYSAQADPEGGQEEENIDYAPKAESIAEDTAGNSIPVLGAMAKSASGGGSAGAYRQERNICVEFSDYPDPNYEIAKRVKEKTGKDTAITGLEDYSVSQTGEIIIEIDGEMINIGKP